MKKELKKIKLWGVNAHSAPIETLASLFPEWENDEIQRLHQAGASPAWWNARGKELNIEFEFLPLECEQWK